MTDVVDGDQQNSNFTIFVLECLEKVPHISEYIQTILFSENTDKKNAKKPQTVVCTVTHHCILIELL